MSSLSNSANAANIPKTNLPLGVVVSILAPYDFKAANQNRSNFDMEQILRFEVRR